MTFDTASLLKIVPEYKEFMTVQEMDMRASALAKKYSFSLREVGKSQFGRSIFLITVGNGSKRVFVWGSPHPNEAVGSWTVDWLIAYFGEHPNQLKKTGCTWYLMYTADPDGTHLNEGWFKGKLSLENYFLHFYRPPGYRQMEWTFPVKYKKLDWKNTLPETEVMMRLLQEIKPDLMYPLHNAGLGAVSFLTTRPFDERYYTSITQQTKQLGIPLDLGEPEAPFMIPIQKPFYYGCDVKDYYEHFVKIGEDPVHSINFGDNSSSYLLRLKPNAITIIGETPYFYDLTCNDTSPSQKTRRELWLALIKRNESEKESYVSLLPLLLKRLKKPDPHYYIAEELEKQSHFDERKMKEHVLTSREYDRIATSAELFWGEIISRFYKTTVLAQVKRAALKAKLEPSQIIPLEREISESLQYIQKHSHIQVSPIQKLVQVQLLLLFETLNAMERCM